jgi:hypothetical protein
MSGHSLTNANELQLVGLLQKAQRRLVLIAPGVSVTVATALASAWDRLGPMAVQIVLDVDSDVCRMGYGTMAGLKVLQEKARDLGETVGHQPGIRIGILVSDDATLVFSPTPLLIEAGSKQADSPNAILLHSVPDTVAADLGIQPGGNGRRSIGLNPLDEVKMKRVERELALAPPQPFDLARQVRVFTSQFQFVELTMSGCMVSRKKVRIPSELMGLARSAGIEQNFHAHFDLVQGEDLEVSHDGRKITERSLQKQRRLIEKQFVTILSDYGSVILRSQKGNFEKSVEALRADVDRFAKGVAEGLRQRIATSRDAVVSALLPAVEKNPPVEWTKLHGTQLPEGFVAKKLTEEIEWAFGQADDLVDDMNVKLVFKDLAYESLVDRKFLETARKAMPGVNCLHQEFSAMPTLDAK